MAVACSVLCSGAGCVNERAQQQLRDQADAFVTISNEVQVLHEIDTICGDTWCCGDYEFKFLDVSVNGTRWQNVTVTTLINRSYQWSGRHISECTNAASWNGEMPAYWYVGVSNTTFKGKPWIVRVTVYDDNSIKQGHMSDKLYNCLTEAFWWAEAQYEARPQSR